MKLVEVSFRSVHGTLHVVCFGRWIGSAFDYPQIARYRLREWPPQINLCGDIICSRDCEAKA